MAVRMWLAAVLLATGVGCGSGGKGGPAEAPPNPVKELPTKPTSGPPAPK